MAVKIKVMKETLPQVWLSVTKWPCRPRPRIWITTRRSELEAFRPGVPDCRLSVRFFTAAATVGIPKGNVFSCTLGLRSFVEAGAEGFAGSSRLS